VRMPGFTIALSCVGFDIDQEELGILILRKMTPRGMGVQLTKTPGNRFMSFAVKVLASKHQYMMFVQCLSQLQGG
ncbi:MAG: hypothetical protein VW491_05145, partial [Gammaproteobacteria bacterium]